MDRRVAWLCLLLFLINFAVAWPLFALNYGPYLMSMEGSFISLARYIRDHFGDLAWFPLWHSGMPLGNVYPPGLHFLVAAASAVLRIEPARAYHAATAIFYAAGPSAYFLWSATWTRRIWPSFAFGLSVSALSPSSLLISAIRVDTDGAFHGRRLYSIFAWGDGPHVAALTLLPLAMLGLRYAIRTRTGGGLAVGAVAMVLVPLVNWPAATVLAMAVVAYILAASDAERGRRLTWVMATSALGYALAAPLIPPSTVLQTVRNSPDAQTSEGSFEGLTAAAAAIVVVGGLGLLVRWLRRRDWPECSRFAILWCSMLGAVVLGWYWLGVTILPQPYRFHLAFEIALLMAVVVPLSKVIGRTRFRVAAAVATASAAVLLLAYQSAFAREKLKPVEIASTSEYRLAVWLHNHMNGRRAFVPGSAALWINAWTDTPQWAGCCDQGEVNTTDRAGQFYIRTGGHGEWFAGQWCVLWLRAYGVAAVVITDPEGKRGYRYFERPRMFDGLLPVAWRDGDDVVYPVSHRSGSVARVVHAADIVRHRPTTGDDLAEVSTYVRALEDVRLPLAEAAWTNLHTLKTNAVLEPGQVLSYHVTWHSGWRAEVNGIPKEVKQDGLGQIMIEPKCNGPCSVSLVFDGGWERIATSVAAGCSALVLAGLCLFRRGQSILTPRAGGGLGYSAAGDGRLESI